MIRRWCTDIVDDDPHRHFKIQEVIREREKLYSLLKQTSPGDLNTQWRQWSINPGTRYISRQFTFNSQHITKLYRVLDDDTDHCSNDDGEEEEDEEEVIECSKISSSKSWSSGINNMNIMSTVPSGELYLKSF